jgi:hypothetical protein
MTGRAVTGVNPVAYGCIQYHKPFFFVKTNHAYDPVSVATPLQVLLHKVLRCYFTERFPVLGKNVQIDFPWYAEQAVVDLKDFSRHLTLFHTDKR